MIVISTIIVISIIIVIVIIMIVTSTIIIIMITNSTIISGATSRSEAQRILVAAQPGAAKGQPGSSALPTHHMAHRV